MSNDVGSLAVGALQQGMARKIDPEQLQVMGKQAAALYTKTGKNLSEAVVEISKHAQLSPEQVRRVCEFANTSAYLEAFEKSGEVRNVTFEGGPADPSYVLKELNDGSVPALHNSRHRDYDERPRSYKTAAADTALAEAFLAPVGLEKAASVQAVDPDARANPVDELYDLHTRLQDVRDQYMSKLSSCEVFLQEVGNDVRQAVKQARADGITDAEIQGAWSKYGSAFMIKNAMPAWAGAPLEKLAGARIINEQHPLIERFVAFTKVAEQHLKLKNLVAVLDEQLAEVNPHLRSALDGLRSA